MPIAPATKRQEGEWFPVIIDTHRQFFEICYPTADDTLLTKRVADANADDPRWRLTRSDERYAQGVLRECQRDFQNHTFVRSALAETRDVVNINNHTWD